MYIYIYIYLCVYVYIYMYMYMGPYNKSQEPTNFGSVCHHTACNRLVLGSSHFPTTFQGVTGTSKATGMNCRICKHGALINRSIA